MKARTLALIGVAAFLLLRKGGATGNATPSMGSGSPANDPTATPASGNGEPYTTMPVIWKGGRAT